MWAKSAPIVSKAFSAIDYQSCIYSPWDSQSHRQHTLFFQWALRTANVKYMKFQIVWYVEYVESITFLFMLLYGTHGVVGDYAFTQGFFYLFWIKDYNYRTHRSSMVWREVACATVTTILFGSDNSYLAVKCTCCVQSICILLLLRLFMRELEVRCSTMRVIWLSSRHKDYTILVIIILLLRRDYDEGACGLS